MSMKHHRPWKKFLLLFVFISATIIFMSYAWATNYQQILAFELFDLFQAPITSVGSFLYLALAFLLLILALPVVVFVYGDVVLQVAYLLLILIAIVVNIIMASIGMSFFSSGDFKTTTVTRTYHLDTHELDEEVRTPSDKAFRANFWIHLLLILLMVDLPFVTLPTILYRIWRGAPFSKKKWGTTLLLTLVSMGVLVGAGIGIQTIDFAAITASLNTQEVTVETPHGILTAHKNEDRQGYTIVAYEGSDQDMIIPNTIRDLPVTSIGPSAFQGEGVRTLVLPSGLKSIEAEAFSGAGNLLHVDFPEGLLSIGEKAFYHTQLSTLSLPSTLTSIGTRAFYECGYLESPIIPSSVTTMGSQIFARYSSAFVIYCEIDEAPEGWDPSWDIIYCSGTLESCNYHNVVWNYTAE